MMMVLLSEMILQRTAESIGSNSQHPVSRSVSIEAVSRR